MILSVILFLVHFAFSEEGFDQYETQVEVPEPMYIDLVRGLHSKKGEWEINSLFSQNQSLLSEKQWAPELEWVVWDGTAIEFEFPMEGVHLSAYKFALQQRIYQSPSRKNLQGLQFLYEAHRDWTHSELTMFYIVAHRFNHYFSALTLLGFKTQLEQDVGLSRLINATLFYNYSEEVDFGVEVNYASALMVSDKFFQVMPQLHLALRAGMKIQFGYGAREVQERWYPMSSLRLIKEFNKK